MLEKASIYLVKGFLFLCCLCGAAPLLAQAVAHPNQINGNIEFDNADPAVLTILNVHGLRSYSLSASSITTPTHPNPFTSSTTSVISDPVSSPYEITVEGGPAGDGIQYNLTMTGYLYGGSSGYYRFESQTSGAVEEEPAPDLNLDFSECAGILRISFEDSSGNPVAVDDVTTVAWRVTGSGNVFQSRNRSLANGKTVAYAIVRGGDTYDVTLEYDITTGTSVYTDLLTFTGTCSYSEYIDCEEIVDVVCVIDPGSGSGGSLGRIVGQVDMLGESEHGSGNRTHIRAWLGPYGNERQTSLSTSSPSSGAFALENMLPSSAVSPSVGYRFEVNMVWGLDYGFQTFQAPLLEGSKNGRVFVIGGDTVDLGDLYVMDPGYLQGDVLLAGPNPNTPPCLADIRRDADTDNNNDNIPDTQNVYYTRIRAQGLDEFATGASWTAYGGLGYGQIAGGLNPVTDNFEGSYHMTLGGLGGDGSVWTANRLELDFYDYEPTSPDDHMSATVDMIRNDIGNIELQPGQSVTVDHAYCMNRVTITYATTSGTFYLPRYSGSGSFNATDFQGNSADYFVSTNAYGTPVSLADAAANGQVVTCLPQGTYNLTPSVVAVNPGGGTSTTNLNPIQFEVGCRQIVNLSTDLQINLDAVPDCAGPSITLSGSVVGTNPVSLLDVSVNGGTPVVICSGCGDDPSFSQSVALDPGSNQLVISAQDDQGNLASITFSVDSDAVAPVLSGCDDITVSVEEGATSAVVDYVVTTSEGTLTCTPASGSSFPIGVTTVTCSATDDCGNTTTCSFTVTVEEPQTCVGAVEDDYTIDWDTCLDVPGPGVLANDCDPDGLPLEAHLFSGVDHGYLGLGHDGSVYYCPEPGYEGEVTFVYKAWTGLGYTTATVTITVTSGNGIPVANDDQYQVQAGTRLTVAAPGVLGNDTDPEGTPLIAHLKQGPAVGHLGLNHDGSFWYDAPAGYSGDVTFIYKASDGQYKGEAVVTITILP